MVAKMVKIRYKIDGKQKVKKDREKKKETKISWMDKVNCYRADASSKKEWEEERYMSINQWRRPLGSVKKTKWLRPLLRLLPSRAVKYEASPSREAEYGCNKLH